MKSLSCSIAILAALVAALAAIPVLAQTSPQEDPAMKAAMEAWTAYGTPGAPHKELLNAVGKWNVEVKFWYAPGTPPEVSKATSEITPWWDGRYVIEKFEGTTPQGPLYGFGISAYDNLAKKYVVTWMDNGSTGVMLAEGKSDASGKVITYWGQMPDPPSKSFKKARMVITIIDEKTRRFESFAPGPDGKEFKSMEMLYTRQ